MKILIISLAIFLTACNGSGCIGTDKFCTERADQISSTGNLRLTLFNNCMGLAAKIPRQADDDVSDIVSECDSTSHYQANHISQ